MGDVYERGGGGGGGGDGGDGDGGGGDGGSRSGGGASRVGAPPTPAGEADGALRDLGVGVVPGTGVTAAGGMVGAGAASPLWGAVGGGRRSVWSAPAGVGGIAAALAAEPFDRRLAVFQRLT